MQRRVVSFREDEDAVTASYTALPWNGKEEQDEAVLSGLQGARLNGVIPMMPQYGAQGGTEYKAEIQGAVSLPRFLQRVLTKEEVLTVVNNVLTAIDVGPLGIPLEELRLHVSEVYVDAQSLFVYVFLLPLKNRDADPQRTQNFFRNLVSSMRFSDTDRDNYVARLLTEINSMSFSPASLYGLVQELIREEMERVHTDTVTNHTTARQDETVREAAEIPQEQAEPAAITPEPTAQETEASDQDKDAESEPEQEAAVADEPEPADAGDSAAEEQREYTDMLQFQDLLAEAEKQPEPGNLPEPEGENRPAAESKPERQPEPEKISAEADRNTADPAQDREEAHATYPCLIQVRTGKKIYIRKDTFTIGKSKIHADFSISDNPAVSRVHVRITRRDGACFLADNGSTNGTYINGKRVGAGEEILLLRDMNIRLGNEAFIYQPATAIPEDMAAEEAPGARDPYGETADLEKHDPED